MMDWLTDPNAWVALLTLTSLEIILGIDNIIFISVLVGRLPEKDRKQGRTFGLALAMISRILLLLSITWVMKLNDTLFTILSNDISGRDLILLCGGLFLLAKSTHEIHNTMEDNESSEISVNKAGVTFGNVLLQVAVIDLVFSLDSVITAVGLVDEVQIMVLAIIISVGVMMLSATAIGNFVDEHPTVKMLALSFLILVAVTLVAEGLDFHFPKGYIYFAMAFSFFVEMLNLRVRKISHPTK
ncbi:MAG: TerC family protein [Candidatus Marinimicrobia bacterium]|nr:TerC family protein [Candidatus Neomarinimicrobiota bacterium]MBT6870466.1 TerC family protein [Candidatus Neomarinimicrobiota bacterium]MBT7377019.1 TerC family protein [Candidatus Neomarinimicrobiota bacterium]